MSDDAEARPESGHLFHTSDPEADAAAEAQLDELGLDAQERRWAQQLADIDDDTAHRFALMLKAAKS